MKAATLIFPDQLFEGHPALDPSRPVYLAEEYLFFRVQNFHKQRLVLLRAAMKAYADRLIKRGYDVFYLDSAALMSRGSVFQLMHRDKITEVHYAEFSDDWLQQDLQNATERYRWQVHRHQSPMFLSSEKEIRALLQGKEHYSMAQFYAYQRKRMQILMEGGKPVGGKFSFDAENRRRLPKGCVIPPGYVPKSNSYVKEAVKYVSESFPKALGSASPFLYPVTFDEAKEAMEDFIHHRLYLFGDYEDAIKQNESYLFHSVLSPLLNCGLLTPAQLLDAVFERHRTMRLPLNSLEGFVRQIIGWREYIRGCYLMTGRRQRVLNVFSHERPLPVGFWDGTTGVFPIDNTIKRVLKTGYCHHIERLMVLGNFLLLTETNPDHVYDWFMANFADAYDWVMVPNVYGMSQYADGGMMTTKPYICGSNYILKMSDYPKGDWADLWDGLYWRFVSKHSHLFDQNPRTQVIISLLKKNAEAISPKIEKADQWLESQSVQKNYSL